MPRRARCRCCGDPIAPGKGGTIHIGKASDVRLKTWKLCAECVAAVAAAIEAVISAMRVAGG